MMMDDDTPSKRRKREDAGEDEQDLPEPEPKRPKAAPSNVQVTALNVNDAQLGNVIVWEHARVYGFVETVTFSAEPVQAQVQRARRNAPVGQAAAQQVFVTVAFDCISATWFDGIVDVDAIAWDTVATISRSCRAEIAMTLDVFQMLSQRAGPVLGLPMPALEEGSWWELRLEPVVPAVAYIPAVLTWPQVSNPVSTLFSSLRAQEYLVDLTVPKSLYKLCRFSHRWGPWPGPDDLAYPG